jgi:hypothetical protein
MGYLLRESSLRYWKDNSDSIPREGTRTREASLNMPKWEFVTKNVKSVL